MASQNVGEDLFPALETLSRLIAPNIKSKPLYQYFVFQADIVTGIILAALVLNQLPLFPDLYTLILSQITSPLILIAIVYFSGIWKLPNGEENNNNASWTSLLAPFFALQTVSNRVGTYFKVGSLISLAYYLSIYYSLPLPFQPWAQYSFIAIASTVSAIAYFFAPVSKIYGPLRFCYLEHAQTYWLVINWWSLTAILPFFSPTLLPIFGFGLVSISVGTWVHIYFVYREKVRTITESVAEAVARAKAAAEAARDYGVTARRYEEQMVNAAAAARRDAVLANTVRITDFFDCAARAWSALGEATAPAEDAIIKARRVIDAAIACEEAEKPDDKKKAENERLARYLRQSAESAHDRARETIALLRAAQASVRASENATRQDAVARRNAEYTAENASNAAKAVSETVAGLQEPEREAAWASGAASRRAEEAIAMATNGEMAEAQKSVEAAQAASMAAEESAKTVREGMDTAQRGLQGWLQSSRKGM
ncbi:hypothetical protein FSARC_11667 [Fusarium sarcochroum]|uniref:Uncharacterized protein n=1 Tax=Fusarium sarcochroum TaxID=1208366 RepID=A0A8H4TDZ6_9HYPO|nr:hypothetical protein FSARC_11667 [Fusarium sarcochroum]